MHFPLLQLDGSIIIKYDSTTITTTVSTRLAGSPRQLRHYFLFKNIFTTGTVKGNLSPHSKLFYKFQDNLKIQAAHIYGNTLHKVVWIISGLSRGIIYVS